MVKKYSYNQKVKLKINNIKLLIKITINMDEMEYKEEDFLISDVVGDGNCGPRVLSLALFGDQNKHNTIRKHVFTYMIRDYKQRISKLEDEI